MAMTQFTHIPHPNPTDTSTREKLIADPGFGKIFTDHMVVVQWTRGTGWHDAEVKARQPIPLDPATSVLHYAQEIFEGMKAYRFDDGSVSLFRPDANASRFNDSARRMAMPEIPEELFIEAVRQQVNIDRDWIPSSEGSALYLRPFMFASEAFLGVRPANEYLFIVIASPVGSYFKGGAKPVTIWASEDYSRAAQGGTGAAKTGGNYAASLMAQAEAIEQKCDQVVFLDAKEHKWVEELGGMNLFFLMDDGTLITPPLGGTILPGITRNSMIQLARDEGLDVREERYSIDQWRDDANSGRLKECFACGTAAVVTAVGEVKSRNGSFTIAGSQTGALTTKLREKLVGIQRGTLDDPHGWVMNLG